MSVVQKIISRLKNSFLKSSYFKSQFNWMKGAIKAEVKSEVKAEVKAELLQVITRFQRLPVDVHAFCVEVNIKRHNAVLNREASARDLRRLVRSSAGLALDPVDSLGAADLFDEFRFIHSAANTLRPAFEALAARRVIFCGQAYYNNWYLSRALRAIGWEADVYNWDTNPLSQIYYHGQDFQLGADVAHSLEGELGFYLNSLYRYDVFHFANAQGIAFGWNLQIAATREAGESSEINLLKSLGKKIVYSNNGCLDGVSQTAFSKWGPESVCSICRWQSEPTVCSDERNLKWGKFRNSVADYQCLLGGNRIDYNNDPRVHEVPEFYCLDTVFWHPDIEVPTVYRRPELQSSGIRLYHAVGNLAERTRNDGVNIKSSHVYLTLIERLRSDGIAIDLIAPTGVPNTEVRYLQVQADIFLDMLTYGWFGATAREAMMLGKPVICFIRPEWLASVHEEIPEYADELPIVSATPETVEAILRDLIASPEKCREIGRRSRDFSIKWHSAQAAGKRFDGIYRALLAGESLLRKTG